MPCCLLRQLALMLAPHTGLNIRQDQGHRGSICDGPHCSVLLKASTCCSSDLNCQGSQAHSQLYHAIKASPWEVERPDASLYEFPVSYLCFDRDIVRCVGRCGPRLVTRPGITLQRCAGPEQAAANCPGAGRGPGLPAQAGHHAWRLDWWQRDAALSTSH